MDILGFDKKQKENIETPYTVITFWVWEYVDISLFGNGKISVVHILRIVSN